MRGNVKKPQILVLFFAVTVAAGAMLLFGGQSAALEPEDLCEAAASTTDVVATAEEFTWRGTRPINLSRSKLNNIVLGTQFPRIVLDQEGHLHAIWTAMYGGSKGEIQLSNLSDIRGVWSVPEVIYPSGETKSEHADISVDGENALHFVWHEIPGATKPFELLYQKEAGAQSESVEEYDSPPAPSIGANDSYVHLTWIARNPSLDTGFDVFHRYSEDGGKKWTSPAPVVTLPSSSTDVELAVDDRGYVHLVWAEGLNGEILYRMGSLTASGIDWGDIVTASSGLRGCIHPTIAVLGTDALIAWGKSIGSQRYDLYFTRCPGGETSCLPFKIIGNPVVVNTADPAQAAPVLAVDDDGWIVAAWHGDEKSEVAGPSTFEEILFSHSTDGGQTWSPVTNVSQTPDERSIDPDVTVSDGIAHIVWRERYDSSRPQKYDTWYVNSLKFIDLPLVMRN